MSGSHTDTGHVVVIGAGIAGLAAAHGLLARHARVTVLEASDRVGGKLLPGEIAGARADFGAESMLARRPEAVALAREVGLADRLRPPATATASLWTRGALRPMPKGHVMGVPGTASALAGVLSDEGLARIERDADLPRTEVGDDVAVGEYVAARLGREVVDRLVEPLLGGVYAGDAYRISMRSAVPQLFQAAQTHTSLTEAVREIQARAAAAQQTGPVFMGIEGGVGRLPLAVAESVRSRGAEILTGALVTELRRETPGGWRVVAGDRVLHADAVIVAVPAPAAAGLLRAEAPEAAAELAAVEYASMALVTLAYRRADVTLPEGSGFLVPPVDGRTIKASTFSSQKWGWVAEQNPDLLVLRTSVGRYGETEILDRDDAHLVDVSRHDLHEATGLSATPVETRVTRWHEGLPQYPVGHHARVARLREHVAKLPGLAVCGAAYDGVGIPACVASAAAAVDQIHGDLRRVQDLTANPVQSLHGGAGE
ncbi:protoporphyrinogen oxidase [Streptomyces ipomoeae]|uniref:Coproporphyrinogen III oxidase n=2 Tax=Streptomyces ipomoeae TaxID=103232 RepID=L1KTM9_9ACTN|nr:protoporphyrinogen oxidase [Streptomyces ipomoeae]EKX63743.1 protoporphyrinogen oxidase [Streptomyces ipomoeae 91-03]MDX2692376.1 protoporphyrinogen oxidase [Streptomyces ipomoeae]MDX2820283.1 protoporphyrinogen oxidase [Streptomyces ipomoeae]MDX2839180.1 protoporphyrinogen oxidase [Streptomyces ipomoeae]MDX2875474.1 protoporphyrinogen oxidase [Streptomyces ipomoeae]